MEYNNSTCCAEKNNQTHTHTQRKRNGSKNEAFSFGFVRMHESNESVESARDIATISIWRTNLIFFFLILVLYQYSYSTRRLTAWNAMNWDRTVIWFPWNAIFLLFSWTKPFQFLCVFFFLFVHCWAYVKRFVWMSQNNNCAVSTWRITNKKKIRRELFITNTFRMIRICTLTSWQNRSISFRCIDRHHRFQRKLLYRQSQFNDKNYRRALARSIDLFMMKKEMGKKRKKNEIEEEKSINYLTVLFSLTEMAMGNT